MDLSVIQKGRSSKMSMVSFMPWCRIAQVYDVGEVKIRPFERNRPIDGIDEIAQRRVNTILGTYKTIDGKPVDRAAIIRHAAKSAIDDLSEEASETIRELVTLACFCGLARRDYFNPVGSYCSSDCFTVYFQKFDQADSTAIVTRRREGQTLSSWPIDDITITVPVHCQTVREVELDEDLLRALVEHRAKSKDGEWSKWQNALACFNQANTDSDNFRFQTEWMLFCGAFEHILDARPDARDVAEKFCNAVRPRESMLASSANRRSTNWTGADKSLRYEWMREFYRIRGDFAHGRLNTQQPAVWNPREHLVLAAIAFPLLVRCLLRNAGQYQLTDDDRKQIEAFEGLANTAEFLKPPSDQKNSLDSHWSRLCSGCGLRLAVRKAVEECEAKGLLSRNDESTEAERDASDGEAE